MTPLASDAPAATAVEQPLLEIWAEVLDIEELGIHSDFFDLGGGSRHAMQIVARVQDAFGVELAPDAVFQTPTVAGLAQSIETAQLGAPSPLPATSRSTKPAEPVLSRGQEEMWCDQIYNPDERGHTPRAYRLTGRLDIAALEQALGEVVRRHDSLRTVFPDDMGHLRAVVLPLGPVSIPVSDLTDLPRRQRETEAFRRVWQVISEPFELGERPPWRAELICLESTVHVFVVSLHEIVCDGWSLGVLFGELSTLYAAFVAGQPSPLADLPLQYGDVAHLEREQRLLHSEYWKRELAGAPLALALPWETAGQLSELSEMGQLSLGIGPRLHEQLAGLARQASVTDFMLYLAAFFAQLHRYTGETDLVVASPSANRPRVELEELIGFFARNLPLRARLDDDPSFRALLGQVRKIVLDGSAHAEAAPGYSHRLMEADGPRGSWGISLGFRTRAATDNPLGDSFELPDIRVESFDDGRRPGRHLWMSISDPPGRSPTVTLTYDEAAFDKATIARMLRSYTAILESGANNPDEPVSNLQALTPDDRRGLVTQKKHKASRDPAAHCVQDLVAVQANRTPDAIAVSSASGDLSYRELIGRANRLAHHLQSLGVAPATTVGLAMDPSAEMVVAMLGILETGCACMPIARDGAGKGPAADLRLDGLVISGAVPTSVTAPAVMVDLAHESSEIASSSEADPGRDVGPESAAFVITTAGVTGAPKAARLSHGAVVNVATWLKRTYRLATTDRAFHLPGPGALTWALAPWPYLASGATVVAPQDLHSEPAGMAEWLGQHRVTIGSLGPSAASALLRAGIGEHASLRMLMVPGTGTLELPAAGVHRKLSVVRQYTIAEAGGVVMSAPAAATADAAMFVGAAATSNAPAFVLNRHLNPVPIGVTGELCLGGFSSAGGYAQAPDLTEQTFVPDPFSSTPDSRLFRTGDLARRGANGTIELLGRRHDEVHFRGFRIAPRLVELETTLQAHPAVSAAAASWDPVEEAIVAYLVLGQDPAVSARELNAWAQENMKPWILPRRYAIVDDLPLRADGSFDRKALADFPSRPLDDESAHASPRTRREHKLASIWKELLGRDDIRIDDNFFLVGGDRVLGLEMIGRAIAAGIPIAPQTLLHNPTIAELAAIADANHDAGGTKQRHRGLAFWQRRAPR